MPAGRTFSYRLYKICERFGQLPSSSEVQFMDRQDLIKLIAYDQIRDKEEAAEFSAQMSVTGMNALKG